MDAAAVWAAIPEPWLNGQTGGQITRFKLIKRHMYGRAKLDLLEQVRMTAKPVRKCVTIPFQAV